MTLYNIYFNGTLISSVEDDSEAKAVARALYKNRPDNSDQVELCEENYELGYDGIWYLIAGGNQQVCF